MKIMINSVNTNQMPYTQIPSASAVNIQIYNPQAYACGKDAVYSMPNNIAMPMGYPQQPPMNQSLYSVDSNGWHAQYPQNYNNDLSKKKDKDITPVSVENKEKVEDEKPKVQLTDEYIMSLENYLNNANPKIRLMAAKDVLERFKEDSSRSTDLALTALLNKMLQDPTETVRFMGLTALDLGHAKGDDLTVQILKKIQQDSTSSYGEDALLASQILLKMSSGQ